MTRVRSPSNGRAPLRVLLSLPDKRVRGGPPSHLYLLQESLRGLGVDVQAFIYGGRTHNEGIIPKLFGRLLDLARLPAQIARHRPHLVQLNSGFDKRGVLRDIFFVTVARMLGQRVITKFHGSDLDLLADRHLVWRLFTWMVVRGSHVVCLLNREEEAAFRARFPRTRFVVVKNALDFRRYRTTDDFRGRYGIPQQKPLLLFIARFIGTKGLKEIITALPMIARHHDVHAVFVGDGPVRAENERRCRELGLGQRTTFTGYIPEDATVGAYLASDLLVFPSYHSEGMPMAVLHSLACGLPIITTRIRAAADWLEEGKHCLFVRPRDPTAVAEAVSTLLERAELREELARNGKELARKFEKTLVAGEFRSLYQSILGRNSFGNA